MPASHDCFSFQLIIKHLTGLIVGIEQLYLHEEDKQNSLPS